MTQTDATARKVASIVGTLDRLGHGAPNGVVAAPMGATYRNLDGGAGCFYVKESGGDGATGWVAK